MTDKDQLMADFSLFYDWSRVYVLGMYESALSISWKNTVLNRNGSQVGFLYLESPMGVLLN